MKYPKEEKLEKQGVLLDIKTMGGSIKLHQKVLAVGPMVRQIKEGDVVQINPMNYVVLEHPEDVDSVREVVKVRNTYTKFSLPVLQVNNDEVLMLQERDIAYIIDDYEE